MSLRFGLLGPVTATRHGVELPLGSPQQRTLLALLLLHRNEVVSTARMLDVLWPGRAPPNALQVLRTYVFRLRGGPLGPPDRSPLITCHHGYELQVADDAVDVGRFEALVAAGRAAFEGGDPPAAEALLREALQLIRGTPLAELEDDRVAGLERDRLEELRAVAEEELVEARLAQGRHRELVGELRAAAAGDRLRERTCGQLMVALYRSGRQAEALEAYHATRRALADELALAPGPQLRDVERMILLQDRALDLPAPRAPVLPRYETSFLGRDGDLAALHAALRGERLVTLVGAAGVGKTRLAAETAAGVAEARVWWVDLGSVVAGRVTASIARTLAVPEVPGRAPADLVVARLREARALLVLDNCEHVLPEVAGFATHALEGDPHARILGTSREPSARRRRARPPAGRVTRARRGTAVRRARPGARRERRGRRRRRAPRWSPAGDRARRRRAAVHLACRPRNGPARAAVPAGRRAAAHAAAAAHARGRDRLELRPPDARSAGGPAASRGVPGQLRRRAGQRGGGRHRRAQRELARHRRVGALPAAGDGARVRARAPARGWRLRRRCAAASRRLTK